MEAKDLWMERVVYLRRKNRVSDRVSVRMVDLDAPPRDQVRVMVLDDNGTAPGAMITCNMDELADKPWPFTPRETADEYCRRTGATPISELCQ